MKPKGKILILANEFYPQICVGGLGKFVAGIDKGLSNNGWEVRNFIASKKDNIYLPYYSAENEKRSKTLARKAWFWCSQHSWFPDWLWTQDFEGIYEAEEWRKSSKGRGRIIWTIHNPVTLNGATGYGYGYANQEGEGEPIDWGNDFFDFAGLLRRGMAAADLVTTVSPTFARELDGFLSLSKDEKIIGINNGIDKSEWDPYRDSLLGFRLRGNWVEFKKINREILQALFGLPPKEVPVFAFVSRLVPQKGIELLTKALPEFLGKNEMQLVIVGQGLAKYHRFFTELKLAFPDKVGLSLGADFSLPHQVFAGADFLLLPSLSEPFGIVVAEARSYGAVPLVRRTGGLADQVADGINGLSFNKFESESLSAKISQALKLWQTDWWWQVSSSGKNRVEDWQGVARNYEDLLIH
ncbi:glycogen synthase [Candidatus Shapirobacteria bacterium]|nr:glycogen synthase [Candidatus Shapirobacteria bacterium]